MSDRPRTFTTQYGMAWYPKDSEAMIFVDRLATIDGRAILRVRVLNADCSAPEDAIVLEIAVSRGGRVIRTYPVRGNIGQGGSMPEDDDGH